MTQENQEEAKISPSEDQQRQIIELLGQINQSLLQVTRILQPNAPQTINAPNHIRPILIEFNLKVVNFIVCVAVFFIGQIWYPCSLAQKYYIRPEFITSGWRELLVYYIVFSLAFLLSLYSFRKLVKYEKEFFKKART